MVYLKLFLVVVSACLIERGSIYLLSKLYTHKRKTGLYKRLVVTVDPLFYERIQAHVTSKQETVTHYMSETVMKRLASEGIVPEKDTLPTTEIISHTCKIKLLNS